MDCFVGASTGALKGVSFRDSSFQNLNVVTDLDPKSDEITSMCWTNTEQTELLTAQMGKQLKLYDTETRACTPLFTLDKGKGAVKGVHKTKNNDVVVAVESGELCVATNTGEIVKELNAGQCLQVMVPDTGQEGIYATGGKENPLKVWDIEKGENTFIAKNVRPDELQLRVPVWETDIRFLLQSHNIVTTTGKHQIRLYDPRTQRRPVKEFEWLEEPITAMSLCKNDMHVIVGNTRGEMGQFDLRNKIGLVCKYKGFAGAISAIDAHQWADYVASCSLDRFVHLHDISTKKIVSKVYCKVRLNRLLLRDRLTILEDERERKIEMQNYEDNWSKMKVNDDGSSDERSSHVSSDEDEALWNDLKPLVEEKRKRKLDAVEERLEKGCKKKKLMRKAKRERKANDDELLISRKKKKILTSQKRGSEIPDEVFAKRRTMILDD